MSAIRAASVSERWKPKARSDSCGTDEFLIARLSRRAENGPSLGAASAPISPHRQGELIEVRGGGAQPHK